MSIINDFHSVKQRSFIRTVVNGVSIYISLALLCWRLNISRKKQMSQEEYIVSGKWNIRTHLLRARVVFKKCFNIRDYWVFSACFFFKKRGWGGKEGKRVREREIHLFYSQKPRNGLFVCTFQWHNFCLLMRNWLHCNSVVSKSDLTSKNDL